ncbi:MAG TPA: type II toxin-antitoxin system VapC family toxin [Rhizobiaceae bacterium]|nr:type II toxin-antitoxin system VapC family toxin [Rhizobiaceae bacterium]
MRIIVDTSALIAILRAEDDTPSILDVLGQAEQRFMSAGNYLEACIVAAKDAGEAARLRRLLGDVAIDVVAVTPADARIGAEAFLRYGRGSGHPAKLNFGDCFAYALAKARNLPLLFKGDDFIHTDVEPALRPAR